MSPANRSYATKVSAARHRLWPGRAPLLDRLDLELTERCNNNCLHCSINLPADDGEAKKRELGTAALQGILAAAANLGVLTVRFTGGEPLLREDFQELYLFARRLGLKVLLFTNARLLTPELADLLARTPPLEPLEVTVYGLRRESYEAVTRVPGSFAEFWRGIELLLDHRIPFVVKGALLLPNRGELADLEAWAATLPAMDKPPQFAALFDLRGRRDCQEKNRLIKALRPTPEEGLAVFKRHGESYRREMREFCSRFLGPPGDRLFACGAGQAVCVDAYGVLQPCLSLRHPQVTYDLQKGSLSDALTNFFPGLLEKARAANPDYLARCARCFLHGLCEQCPAKSWSEHGVLDTPVEYLCQVAHAQARDLGLLAPGERAWEVKDWRERKVADD